jgi:mannobiose 2-epimerase
VIDRERVRGIADATRRYLTDVLLPFWMSRAPDREAGGFLTWFDRDGEPTGETTKTLLMQVRMLFSLSTAHRAGYGDGQCLELARTGADFVLDHFWDELHGGWFWIADRHGRPTVMAKVGYGQCFAMYAFAEYFLAGGDERALDAVRRTHAVVQQRMRDPRHGGYRELFERDWRPTAGGRHGGDRKSFDVHMHMMEALTNAFLATGDPAMRTELLELIELIRTRMLEPERGTGLMQFALDLTPLPAIRFATVWGADEDPPDGEAFPLAWTSYGHNVEFAWLLWRAADALGLPRSQFAGTCCALLDHCLEFGIDRELGGVYVDGPVTGPAGNLDKQFWQHAEVMVGMLDAWREFGDDRYWHAFENVWRFVFAKLVHLRGGGEWFGLCERDGTPIHDQLGTGFKISYHTVRSMVEVVRGLEAAD